MKAECSIHGQAETALQLSPEDETRSKKAQISTACVISTKLLLLERNLGVRSRDSSVNRYKEEHPWPFLPGSLQPNSNYRKSWKRAWHGAHSHVHTVPTYQEGSLLLWRRAWSSCVQTFMAWLSATPYGEEYTGRHRPRNPLLQRGGCFFGVEAALGFLHCALP